MLVTKTTAKLASLVVLALGTVAMAAQQGNIAAGGGRGDLDEIRKVSTLVGTNVMNRADTKVAVLRDLVFSPGGEMRYAVLGTGGVGGVAETYTAAPIDVLQIRHTGGQWTAMLDRTAEDLKNAPTIRSDNYRELTDPQWIGRVHQFFRPRGEAEDRPVETVLLATKICGATLKNPQNEDLGKVEDLLLDRAHRLAFAVVGRGGVLGVGEHFIPVPWAKMGIGSNSETAAVSAAINATKAQFAKAPMIKGSDYSTLLAPGFADEVRHFFGAIGGGTSTGAGSERR